MEPLLSGGFTLRDAKLYEYMRDLLETENIFIEPSSCAAFEGPTLLGRSEEWREYIEAHGIAEKMKKALERLRVAFFAKVYMKRKFQEMPVSLIVPFWWAAKFRWQWTGRLVPFCLSSLVRYSRDGLCRCCRLLFLSWSFIHLDLCK